MPQEIERVAPARDEPVKQHAALVESPTPEQPSLNILATLRRRWRLAVIVALACAAAMNAGIWTLLKSKYEATALITVEPVVPSILYQTEQSGPLPLYDNFVNTQVRLLLSREVLTRALQDPAVRDLPGVQTGEDPIATLASAVTVGRVPNSQLIQVKMLSANQAQVAPIVNATVNAYMEVVGNAELQQNSRTIGSLERERETLMNKRKQLIDAIHQLAEEFGTTAVGDRQGAMFEGIQQINTALAQAEVEALKGEARLEQLEKGGFPILSADDLAVRREAFVNSDTVVSSLAEQLATALTGQQAYLASGLGSEHRLVRANEQRIEGLRQVLATEKLRAAAEFDRQMQDHARQMSAAAIAETQQDLERTLQLKELLTQTLRQKDLESSQLGQKGLSIQTLQEELDAVKEEYERVSQRLRQLEMERQRPARISLASAAETPRAPSADKRMKYTAVAIMASVFLAAAFALLLDRLDTSVRALSDVQVQTQLRVLGTVPRLKDLLAGRVNREEFAEAFRMIRACLSQSADGALPRSLLVTSAQGGEGKTGLAINLAASVAETGQRVLLIDGDLRKPDVADLLKLADHDRLVPALLARRALEELAVPSAVPNLDVLPAARTNGQTVQVLTLGRVKSLLAKTSRLYDMVIIDSPPVLEVADALVWAAAVDGVVFTVLADRSNRAAIWAACQRLGQVHATVLGAVVGNLPHSAASYGYGYHSRSESWDGTTKQRTTSPTSSAVVVLPAPSASDGKQPQNRNT